MLSTFEATVITISDRCARREREDLSGPAVVRTLEAAGFRIVGRTVLADEQPAIEDALRHAAASPGLVITTGGTGIAARDVTPEATRAICTRLLDGLSEAMRAAGVRDTPYAVLSRGLCGVCNAALVINLPGSPEGAVRSLAAVLPVLPHALRLLVNSDDPHPPAQAEGGI